MTTYYSDYSKNGKKIYYTFYNGRYFKASAVQAELDIATGKGVEAVYLPNKPYSEYTDLQLSRALRCHQEAGHEICVKHISEEIASRKARKAPITNHVAAMAA